MQTEQGTDLEIPEPRLGRRRRFSSAEKQAILLEADAPGSSVSSVGRRYGLSVSLLFRWKRQLDQEIAAAKAGTSAVGKLRARLAQLEVQLQGLSSENDLLREALERGRREGRVPAVPARLADLPEKIRPDGRA